MIVKIKKKFIDDMLNETLMLVCFLIILPLDSGPYLFPVIDKFLDSLRMIMCIILFIIVILKYKKINEYILLIFLLSAPLLLITAAKNGDLWKCIVYIGNLVVSYLFVYIFMVKKSIHLRPIIYSIRLLLVINTILFFLIPGGMFVSLYPDGSFNNKYQWLLGTKNSYFPLLFFYIVVNEISIYKECKKRLYIDWIFYMVCLFNIFLISMSTTGIIGIVLLFMPFILQKYMNLSDKKILFMYVFCVFVFSVIIFKNNTDGFVMSVISMITGKNATFTGRVKIWEIAFKEIMVQPIFGYGIEFTEVVRNKLGQFHTHNKYISILYHGGIILGAIYMVFFVKLLNKLLKIYNKNDCAKFICNSILSLLIVWETEPYDYNRLLFIFITICFFSNEILVRHNSN